MQPIFVEQRDICTHIIHIVYKEGKITRKTERGREERDTCRSQISLLGSFVLFRHLFSLSLFLPFSLLFLFSFIVVRVPVDLYCCSISLSNTPNHVF